MDTKPSSSKDRGALVLAVMVAAIAFTGMFHLPRIMERAGRSEADELLHVLNVSHDEILRAYPSGNYSGLDTDQLRKLAFKPTQHRPGEPIWLGTSSIEVETGPDGRSFDFIVETASSSCHALVKHLGKKASVNGRRAGEDHCYRMSVVRIEGAGP